MKKFIVFGALITFFMAAAAQDQKAKSILEQVSSKTQSFKTIAADFIFSMDNSGMNIHEKNEGSIKLKGQKYVVNLPELGVKIYSDGESVWNYMEDGNQVTVTSLEEGSGELMNPSSLFSIYEQGYDSKYTGEKKADGKAYHQVELFPGKDKEDISKITLLIDKTDMMIHSATLEGADGNNYGIVIKNMKTNTEIPDKLFVFEASQYGDVEIIDFR